MDELVATTVLIYVGLQLLRVIDRDLPCLYSDLNSSLSSTIVKNNWWQVCARHTIIFQHFYYFITGFVRNKKLLDSFNTNIDKIGSIKTNPLQNQSKSTAEASSIVRKKSAGVGCLNIHLCE